MTKTNTIGQVTFTARGRRWDFEAPGYSFGTSGMHGGRETAVKVVNVINAGVNRTKGKGIDGLARSNMNTILHKAAKASSRMVNHLGLFA